MNRIASATMLALLALGLPLVDAFGQVEFEAALGTAFNAPSPLVVNQSGFDPIRITADYSTRPFIGSPYYQIQLGLWNKERTKGWVLGFLHHKLYLDNRPPEIQEFAITFGYNTLYLGRAWRDDKLVFNLGAGAIIANPLTEVRGQTMDRRRGFFQVGWYFAGGTIYGSLQRRIPIDPRVFLGLGAKVTASMAWISVADGNARVPNLALHIQAAIGVGSWRR